MQQSKFREAIAEFYKAKRGYERHGSGRDVADSLYYAGVCYKWLDDQHQTAKVFEQAKQKYLRFIEEQEADPVEVGKACLELSMLLPDDSASAVKVLSRAMKIFQEYCQYRHLVTVLLNMSCVANRMLLFTNAENYARRALELAKDFDPVQGVGFAHGNIAAALENRGDLVNAKSHYETALRFSRRIGDVNRSDQMYASIQRVNARLEGGIP
jgi:tetratricopeptide (TPR) repeat protein